jgi:anti-sigma regulatory factor (Ser/Thr protein kinase)
VATPMNVCVSHTRLAAVLTAVGLSREFVRQTLRLWQLADHVDTAELIVSELVTNAVKETGVTDPSPTWEMVKAHHIIGVQLRLVNTSLYVEVWDRGSGSPEIPEQSLDTEGGRGLYLVESLSKQWDICRPAVGGKVVWAELLLDKPVNPSLFVEVLPLCNPGTHSPVAGEESDLVDTALMERAVNGLDSVCPLGMEVTVE